MYMGNPLLSMNDACKPYKFKVRTTCTCSSSDEVLCSLYGTVDMCSVISMISRSYLPHILSMLSLFIEHVEQNLIGTPLEFDTMF